MTQDEIRKFFFRTFRHDAQRSGQAQAALDTIYQGLESLLRIGFPFTLEPGSGYIPMGWPKMMYSPVFGERIVNSPDEAGLLEGPWSEAPIPVYIPSGKVEIENTGDSNGRTQE